MSSIENNSNETFIQEALELLEEIETVLLELEESADDLELVNKLFRAFHTLKGAGGMFGFENITEFTHNIETALDQIRNGVKALTKEFISLSLQARDMISEMVNTNEGTKLTDGAKAIMKEFTEFAGIQEQKILPPEKDKAEIPHLKEGEVTFRIRFTPPKDLYRRGTKPENLFEELRELGELSISVSSKYLPSFEDIKPDLCYLHWDMILTTEATKDAIEDVFIFIVDDSQLSIEVIAEHNSSSDVKRLGEILVERGDISHEELQQGLEKTTKIGEILVQEGIADNEAVTAALKEQEQVRKVHERKSSVQSASTIRVKSERLDKLVDLVGEMVTNQARLIQLATDLNSSDLQFLSEQMENLVGDLRDEVMGIRMVPVGNTFKGFKRLIRELSETLKKPIKMTVSGEDTELDKNMIEQLKDPLVHIIRNSADHGIESPERRISKGKKPEGTIHLSAEHTGASVVITIVDDGAGLDLKRIKQKSIEKGIIADSDDLSDKEIAQMIFAPGFSTASAVSNVSGRGVGMDVVKQNIEALRGTIDVSTEAGIGTTIKLKLPLTLAIIDGLMVTIDDDFFILPLSSVEECIDLHSMVDESILGRNIINLRGNAVPFIDLRDHLEIIGERPEQEQIVIAHVDDRQIGFVVDTVIGSHQTVIKSLGPVFKRAHDFSGATILGDGTVALILDIHKILN